MKKTIWTAIAIIAFVTVALCVVCFPEYANVPCGWKLSCQAMHDYIAQYMMFDVTLLFGGVFALVCSMLKIRKEIDKGER